MLPWMSAATAAGLSLALIGAPLAARADDTPSTFIAVGPLTYSSSTFINRNGQTVPSGCDFQKSGESLYVQHDLDPEQQVRLSTEYDADRSCDGATRGLNDVEIDYLHGLSGSSHPKLFSIEASVIVPPGYSIETNPRLGLGRPAAELGALYQGTFKIGTQYGYIISGVNVRGYTGYPAPQLLSNFTAGFHATSRILIYESYFGTTHLGAGGTLTNIGLNPLVNSVYDAYYLSENLAYSLSPRTSLAVTYQDLIGGWNTGVGATLQAGLWERF